jgi:hypothetical protein
VEGDDDGVDEVEGDDVGVCECYFVGNVDGVGGSGGDVDFVVDYSGLCRLCGKVIVCRRRRCLCGLC